MVVVMGVGLKSRYRKLLLCIGRAFMEVVVGDGDRGPGTDLRGRSSVCVRAPTSGHDSGIGEPSLNKMLHGPLPQHH